MRSGFQRLLLTLVCLATIPVAASGQSPQNLPPVNLGFTSFVDGAPPAGPGLYFAEYLSYYTADQFNDAHGDALPLPDPQLDLFVSLTQFIYMWDYNLELLGAKPALDVLIPVIAPDLDFAAPVPLTANSGGVGDLLIGPALQFDPIMGEQGPLFVHRVEAQFNIPTGKYSSEHIINPGAGFFSFNPYWAATTFLTPRDSLSWRMHYLWCAENENPAQILGPGVQTTRAGQAFHVNFAADHEILEKRLRVGLNGYYLKQTTDAQVNGIDVPDSREQVLALGPGGLVSFSQTQHLFCNVYWESEALNRPEGFKLNLRYVYRF